MRAKLVVSRKDCWDPPAITATTSEGCTTIVMLVAFDFDPLKTVNVNT